MTTSFIICKVEIIIFIVYVDVIIIFIVYVDVIVVYNVDAFAAAGKQREDDY